MAEEGVGAEVEDELEAADLIAVLIWLGCQLRHADVRQVLQHLLVLFRQLRATSHLLPLGLNSKP